MTLRERLARGPERRIRQQPIAVERRHQTSDIRGRIVDPRPEWLRRASFRRDLTEAKA